MILTSSKIRGYFASSLFVISACQNKADVSGGATKKSTLNSVSSPTDNSDTKDEQVTPPANITGTYLHCEVVNVPFDAENASTLGCAIYDEKTDARVDVASIATNIDWSYDRSKVSGETAVSIFKAEKSQNLDFDVYYSFTNFSGVFADVLAQFVIVMDVTGFNNEHTIYSNSVFTQKPTTDVNDNPGNEKPVDVLGGT